VQWLRDGLKIIKSARDVEALAKRVNDTGDVVFVPALAGLGAPHWRPDARGLFAGLDRSTTSAHLARAVLEGVALQIFDLAEAMKRDSGREIPTFKVDGGAAANNLMMQFQADVLGTEVVRPRISRRRASALRSWPAWGRTCGRAKRRSEGPGRWIEPSSRRCPPPSAPGTSQNGSARSSACDAPAWMGRARDTRR